MLSLDMLGFLFAVAILAGFVDTLAGGGGLLTIPALVVGGVPPLPALATNKLQGSVGTATATYMMIKNKRIAWIDVKWLMLTAFIGSALGTIALQFINTAVISFVIPIVLLGIAVYFLLLPLLTFTQQKSKVSSTVYCNAVVPAIGFYDGMFGPGTGSFFALSGMAFRNHNLLASTAVAKSLNFATNIASLIVFVVSGHIVWVVGLLMMLGQAIGARLGAHYLYKINPVYIRWMVVVMCCGMLIRYAMTMGWIG